jgi:hypothetical protein
MSAAINQGAGKMARERERERATKSVLGSTPNEAGLRQKMLETLYVSMFQEMTCWWCQPPSRRSAT